jgi:hypothetical protein
MNKLKKPRWWLIIGIVLFIAYIFLALKATIGQVSVDKELLPIIIIVFLLFFGWLMIEVFLCDRKK